MRKLIVCAAMALTLGMAGLAQAGCTAEEAQQKAATFAQVVQAKAQQTRCARSTTRPSPN